MKPLLKNLRRMLLAIGAVLTVAGHAASLPPEVLTLLSAQTEAGQPVVSPEQRTYVDGLNDHLKGLLAAVVTNQLVTKPSHLSHLLALKLRPQKLELLLQDHCLLCHTDPEVQTAATLFTLTPGSNASPAHLNLKDLVEDTHFRRGLSCAGCHGGDPTADFGHDFVKQWPESGRRESRAWILDFCARCHSDPTFMNRFNPSLPTDQLAKFRESPHGRTLLEQKDNRAPTCISCHGVHGIRDAKNPDSKVYARNVPATCGACHANPKTMAGFKLPDGSPLPTSQYEQYRSSVHGLALLQRGDLGAPACNDCHGNHAAMPVGVSSVSQSCSLCHANNASLFDGSKHKVAFEQHNWPQCAQCHGKHAIAKTHDSMLGTGEKSVCVQCHGEYAKDNPKCNATADYFYNTVTQLQDGLVHYQTVAEQLAVKGLDIDPIDSQLNKLEDDLRKSRSYIHSFSSNSFQQAAAPGEAAITTMAGVVKQAKSEYRYRQAGLLASITLMGLMMIAFYLKLRKMERPSGEPK